MKKNLLFASLIAVTIQVTAQVPNYVTADSLIGFWDFNGNLTNSLSSGIVLNTTGSNGYTQDRNGNASSALSSGAALQNSINGFNATQQFTIGGWVNPYLMPAATYPANYIGYLYRMEYEVNNMFGPPTVGVHTEFAFLSDYIMDISMMPVQGPDYGKIYFKTVIGGVTRILKSSTNYNTNTWYHVMVNYDQSFLRLYVNGVCTDSLAATGNLDYSNYNGGFQQTHFQTSINHGNDQYTSTVLDKMGFWRRALQPCEVLNLYEESTTNCGSIGINAPTNLSATWNATTSEVVLNWEDNSSNETGFSIERSTNGVNYTVVDTVAANVLTYTDNTVSPQTTYYYRVFAFNMVEDSDFSNVVQVSTGTAGLADLSASTIHCYPNPAKDYLLLEGLSIGEKLTITGLTGEVVLEQIVQQEIMSINVNNLASGIYLMRAGNHKPWKISVQH